MRTAKEAERESDLLLASLKEYVLGEEWRHNIDAFVKSNCYHFRQGACVEYSHTHHEVWQTFQEIAEQILEMALAEVGGSISKLEKALGKLASQPAKGPREAATQAILEQLLSFSSFYDFAQMMSEAAAASNAQPPFVDSESRSSGHRGGDRQDGSNRLSSLRDKHLANLKALGFFEEMIEAVLESADGDVSLEELVMTLSELQSHNSDAMRAVKGNSRAAKFDSTTSTPPKQDASPGRGDNKQYSSHYPHIEKFAAEIGSDALDCYSKLVMAKSIIDTFHAGNTSSDIVSLLDWSNEMIELFGSIEAASQEGIAFGDMRHRHSEGLVAWFWQLERTRHDLEAAQATGHMLSDAELRRIADLNRIAAMGTEDEQYLHSLITRYDDVQKQVDALHLSCGALVSADVIKRESLEELYLYLKEKVASGADLEALTDEMHDKVYSVCTSSRGVEIVSVLLDMHVLEDEQTMLRHKINSILGSPSRAEDKDRDFKDGLGDDEKGVNGDFKSGAKEHQANNADAKESEEERVLPGDKDERTAGAASDHLEALKRKHMRGLQSLKQSLEADRARRLRGMDSRLQGRQRGGADAEDAAVQALKSEQLQEGVISGYKKRCMHEMSLARKKGSSLTMEEEAECRRAAADALKERYLRDNKQLLELLEHERARQKEHLLAQLKERSKKSKSLTDERRLIEQFKADVESKDRAFDEDALGAMASSQTKILLNLAAIFADDETLLSSRERSLDDDDFDTYLEDSGGHGSQGLARWLQDSEGVADAYVSAGLELQRRVQGAHRSENGIASISDDSIVIEELEGEDAGASSVLPVLSHMTTVIVDAFTYHIKSAGGGNSCDAKDSILREFERARSAYDEAVLLSQQTSRSKLAARRGKSGSNSGGGSVAAVVDDFLRDPMALQYQPRPRVAGGVLPALPFPRPVAPLAVLNGKRVLAPLDGRGGESFNGEQYLDNGNKDRLLSQYTEKERKLVSDLEDQMLAKKRTLEERLQQKREAASKARDAAAEHKKDVRDFLQEEGDAEVAAAQAELLSLQSAFDRVVDYVRKSDDADLGNMDAVALAKTMAQMMREEPPPDPLQRGTEERILMQAEVKRLTEVYNEEKQKHDLIMKMQQTRQRQMLQRKLLERKGVAGKGSVADEDVLELSFSQPKRVTPYTPQQSVRGLDLDRLAGNAAPTDAGLASRGLHLSPLLRK